MKHLCNDEIIKILTINKSNCLIVLKNKLRKVSRTYLTCIGGGGGEIKYNTRTLTPCILCKTRKLNENIILTCFSYNMKWVKMT